MTQTSNAIHGRVPIEYLHILIFRTPACRSHALTRLVDYVDANLRRLLFGYFGGGKLSWIALQTT